MTAKFDWSQFKDSPEAKTEKAFDWSEFKSEPEESPQSSIKRNVARSGARIGETILGYPGDLGVAALKGINYLAEKVPGGKPKSEEEIESIASKFPTSGNIKKFHEKVTGEYLKPKNEYEEMADDFLELGTSLALPGPKTLKGGKVLEKGWKATKLAALGTGVKHGAKAIGADEDTANIAGFVSMAVPSLLKGKNPKKAMDQLYDEAEALLPHRASVNAGNLPRDMRALVRMLQTGTSTPSKTATLTTARDLLKKSSSGSIGIEELQAFKRDINELAKDPALLRGPKKFLPMINEKVKEKIADYGKTNPNWYEKWSTADSMFGGLASAKKASSFLGKYDKFVKNPAAMAVLGLTNPLALKGAAAYTAASKGFEIMHRITMNKHLRKHYLDVIKSAGKEQPKLTQHYLKVFNEEMEKEFPEKD